MKKKNKCFTDDLHKFFDISENIFGIRASKAERKRMCNRWIKADKMIKKALTKIIEERK